MKQRTGISVFVIVVCGTLLLSSWLARQDSAVGRDAYQNIEAFANVLTMVQKNYVDQVSTDQLIDGAINGMLSSLDPHSAYLTPDLYKELQVDTRGSFGIDSGFRHRRVCDVTNRIHARMPGRARRRIDVDPTVFDQSTPPDDVGDAVYWNAEKQLVRQLAPIVEDGRAPA